MSVIWRRFLRPGIAKEIHCKAKEPPKAAVNPVHYEAEDLYLNGYGVEHKSFASDGALIKLDSHQGHATKNFDGLTGTYDIIVGYFDENDGESHAEVFVGGDVEAAWDWAQDSDSNVASESNFTLYGIDNVHIGSGEQIKLSASRNEGEFGRFDFVKFVAADTITNDRIIEDHTVI